MASTSSSAAVTYGSSDIPSRPAGELRGGRRAGRRGNQSRGGANPASRGGPRRDGRGGRHEGTRSNAPGDATAEGAPSVPNTSLENNLDSGGGSGVRPTGAATENKGEEEDGDAEAEVCFICASNIVHQAVTPCNHRTCHECSLRTRALYKNRHCLHCRTEAPKVIFTDDGEKRFEEFTNADFENTDEILGISYESKIIQEDTTLLLRYNCPDPDCEVACFGWPDLHRHVRTLHHKQMCDLCTRNKKVFTHEHALFNKEELRRHEKFGDTKPGEADTTGFKGHPECGFCRQRFYSDDELFVHCREKHEKCHICERQDPTRQHQYYVNYDSLEQHFRKDHFLCPDSECLEKKFVVFGSEMDLKAHQLESHPNGLTKDARRDARRVDMSNFDIRQAEEQQTRRRGRGGASARGRDPNTEPLPVSTAQPLSRAEIAYQRQMAIQSAQSVTTRSFGGQLTSGEAYAARPGGQIAAPATVNVPRTASAPHEIQRIQNASASSTNALGSGTAATGLTPQEQARRIQHSAVVDRAAQMLGHEENKVTSFRSRVSQYRTGALNPTQMIDSLLALFDVQASELGTLIKELANLYDNDAKRTALLTAWNDWRAINEDYPTLPGPNGALPNQNTIPAGRRILKLKSSTAQSQRAFAANAASQSRGWGAVTGTSASASSTSALPTSKATAARASNASSVPWAGASSARTTPMITGPPSTRSIVRPAAPATDAFPSLPAASKPNVTMAGRHRGAAARWDTASPITANPWAGGASSTATAEDADDQTSNGKKKGRKGKQQTLYHFG